MPQYSADQPLDSIDPGDWARAFKQAYPNSVVHPADLERWFRGALETGHHYGAKRLLLLASERAFGPQPDREQD